MRGDIHSINVDDHDYPPLLRSRLGEAAPKVLYARGDLQILRNPLLGLLCSVQCPGSIIIKTFDAIRELRDKGIVVIGGFHSPMERECLDILLRGKQPVVLVAARGLRGLRIGEAARNAIDEGRLLLLSPFADTVRRTTATQAVQRNNLVAALAEQVLVPYAVPGGKTWATVHSVLERQQPVFTFEDEANKAMLDSGAHSFLGRCT